jgi:Uncharacterised protein conserved in bacteria (DUF2336)
MMPEEWPIAAEAAERNAPSRRARSGRLSTVRVDFFLDPDERLTEQERALMTAMLHCLVGDVADEMRASLPAGWAAANDQGNVALVEQLIAANLLDEPLLMALLLRRADEERIATGAKARSGRRDARTLQGLVSHEDGAISAAAMALILARGRRRDRFGQCLVAFDDLAPETAERLVQSIAAALRRDLASGQGAGAADSMLAEASGRVLERIDPERSVEWLTAMLVELLAQKGALGNELLLAAAHEGEISFVASALARQGGIDPESALDELLSGDPRRLMAVLRVAGASRELGAGLLAGIGDLLGIADPGEALGIFERMTDDQVSAARAWLSTAPAYRSALAALGVTHG